MTPTEIVVMALATLAGPVLAVQAQKWIEWATERRKAQKHVFHWLMATRATKLSTEHVQALNRIELEFGGKSAKEKAVRDAWRLYADKLNETFDGNSEAALATWASSRENLFTELMFAMSKCLGYNFDRIQIMRGIYYPRGHGELEERQRNILMRLEAVLTGNISLPIRITEAPHSPEAAKLQEALADKMSRSYSNDGALRIRITNDEEKGEEGRN